MKYAVLVIILSACATVLFGQTNTCELADSLIQAGKPDLALKHLDNPEEEADVNCLLVKGQAYLRIGRNDLAEEVVKLALDKAKKTDDKLQVSNCLAELGLVYWAMGQNYEALEYQLNSLEIRKSLSDKKSIAASYNDIGLVYSMIDPESASQYYRQALEQYRNLYGQEDERTANTYVNLGLIINQAGKHEEALDFLQKALEIKRGLYGDQHPNIGFIHASLGQVYAAMGKYQDAIESYRLAEIIYRVNYGEKHPELANIYNMVASLELDQGNFEKALESIQNALQADVTDFSSADLYTNPGLTNYMNPNTLLASFILKSQALEYRHYHKTLKRKDLIASFATCELADSLVDKIRHIQTNQEDKLFLSSRANELYETAISISLGLADISLFKQEFYKKAFYFSEKGKAIVLLDAITDANARAYGDIPSVMLDRENNLRSKINFITTQLVSKHSEKNDNQLRAQLLEMTTEYERFIHRLEQDYPEYYKLKYDSHIPGIEEIQSELPSSTILQSYFIGENRNRLFIFQIGKHNFKVFNQSLDPEFNRNLIGFRNSIVYDLPNEIERTGSDLYDQLIPRRLPARARDLVIIPSGKLGITPFEALVRKPGNRSRNEAPQYLIRDINISYQYSATLALQDLDQRDSVSGHATLFAPVNFEYPNGRTLTSLPSTVDEVDNITQLLTGTDQHPEKLLYADASEDAFKSTRLTDRSFIHIASHGVVNEQHPELSCIYLSPNGDKEDGSLYSGEIYNLKLDANLIALSACQTGMGRIYKGEGIIGLSRALLYAGARNMLVSLWQVDDKATADLMTGFYRACFQNKENFSESLGDIKRRFIKDPVLKDPYYWASFILIGK